MVKMIPNPSDGSEAALSGAKQQTTYEARVESIRATLFGRPMACPDCRTLRDAFVLLLDSASLPSEKGTTVDVTAQAEPVTVASHPNSEVKIVPPTPPTPGAAAGGEVAPGVVIIPKQ